MAIKRQQPGGLWSKRTKPKFVRKRWHCDKAYNNSITRYRGAPSRIDKSDVEGMGSYANKLVVNFPSVGLYEYNGSTWKRINPNAAEDMIAVNLN
jgi:hypothetical protein